ncbi:MAG TPA: alginate export family protein [Blastocatellia bacterium]|nr:alginate export family protein [Blastocatellia bacterium]
MTINIPFWEPRYESNRIYKTSGALALVIFLSLNALAQSAVAPASPEPTPRAVVRTAPAQENAPIKIGSLTVSGSVNARVESWDWFDSDAADGSYNYPAIVLRLGIGQSKEKFEWFVEGLAPVLLNLPDNAIAPAPQGQLGLGAVYFAANGRRNTGLNFDQGYVRFKGLFGNAGSSLKLGRFEFGDGLEVMPADPTLAALKRTRVAQRLIGPFGFTHVTRSFDGALYAHQSKTSNFTFLAARPTSGAFDINANNELDIDFYYGAFTKPLKHKSGASEYRLFTMHYHDGRRVLKTDNRPAAARAADFGKIRLTTTGGHFISAFKTGGGKTDVLVWGAGQFGNWGNLDHRAGAIAFEVGYQPGGKLAEKIRPWIRGGYFRSTGDGDPTDGANGTFFQNLPTARAFARFPFFNLMNNEDTFAELRLRPSPKLTIRGDIRYLRLSNENDLWYQGGGAFQKQTFGFAGRPSLGGKSLGTLADVSLDYAVTPRTQLSFYLGGVRGGSVISNIHPLGGNARFAYVEINQRF